ncbi:MAG: hypothetical protein IT425_12080 [Pirellulales bacterium]|nr:hypothetical protein [Pirellulales bacterium]
MGETVEMVGTPKVHPASREVLPEDPMEMHGVQITGDPELMLRMLVEEFARMGWGLEEMMHLAKDPNYSAFHGLSQAHGEEKLRERIGNILARCGVMRVKATEAALPPEDLVQIDLGIE